MKKAQGYTYKEAHNKAVTSYQKNVSTFFWLGLLNLVGIVMGIVSDNVHYFPALATNVTIFRELDQVINDAFMLLVIKVLAGMITTASLIFAWLFAKKGNKYALYSGIAFYSIETIVMFVYMSSEPIFIPQLLLHLLIAVLLLLALGAYYQIFAVEKRFNKKN